MTDPISLLAWLGTGAALGAVYLWLIARTVAAIQPPGDARAAVMWLLLRVGLAAGTLVLAAMQGAAPLLAVLAGFMGVRSLVLRRARSA